MSDLAKLIQFQRCEDLDPDGDHELLCFRGLSPEAQDAMYRAVFATGCEGEAGGLMTQEERAKWKQLGQSGEYTVESCFGNKWHVDGEEVMLLADMGFHGRHHLLLKDSSACQALVDALRASAPASCSAAKPPEFQPEHVAVSYENLGGRVIKGTLCGTAYDDDRCSRRGEVGDGTPKAFLFLGRAAVTVGFKYDKSDKQWLRVRMAPGDCLLRFGAARAWCMGVLKIDASAPEGRGDSNPCPFDFVHVKLCDHRRLQKEKPDLFSRCHAKRIDPMDDKFNMNPGCFQYAYSIVGPDAPGGPIKAKVVNDNGMRFAAVGSGGTLGHGVTMAQACYTDLSGGATKGRGRGSKGSKGGKGRTPQGGERRDASRQQERAPVGGPPRRWATKRRQSEEAMPDDRMVAA